MAIGIGRPSITVCVGFIGLGIGPYGAEGPGCALSERAERNAERRWNAACEKLRAVSVRGD